MTAARANHDVLVLGAVGGAGFLAYEFLYKPWKLKKDAEALGATSTGSLYSNLPSVGSLVSAPSNVNPGGTQGSIVDARITPGGDVGQAMWRKNWTQQQAQTRLDALKAAYATATAAVTRLKAGVANPNAAGVAAARVTLGQLQQAAANADAQAAQNDSVGDTVGAQRWRNAAVAFRQDAREVEARIAAASQQLDVSSDITAWQAAAAGHDTDYYNLTGRHLAA